MWYLIRKFSLFYAVYFLIAIGGIFPLMNHDRLTAPDPNSLNFALTLMPFIFWVVIGSLWSHEQWEYRNNGYAFLSTLPVDAGDIVKAKFVVAFLTAAAYVLSSGVFFFLVSRDPDYWGSASKFGIVNTNLCLVLVALSYIGIFQFGFAKFGKFLLLTWFLLFISPIPINQMLLPRLGISRVDAILRIANINWLIVTAVSLAIYLILMKAAVRTYEARRD